MAPVAYASCISGNDFTKRCVGRSINLTKKRINGFCTIRAQWSQVGATWLVMSSATVTVNPASLIHPA